MAELLGIVTLCPKAATGLAEVPSLGATGYVTPMLTASLGIAIDLAFFLTTGGGMASCPLDPASLGEMSGTLSLGRFSRIKQPPLLVGLMPPLSLHPWIPPLPSEQVSSS